MINFRSSSLALAMTLAGSTLSTQVSALPVEFLSGVKEIKTTAGDDSDATIVANINGENFRIELPQQALEDKDALEAVLSGLPEDVREKVSTALADVELGAHKLKLKQLIVDAKVPTKGLVKLRLNGDSGQERVIVVDVDEADQGLSHHRFFESLDDLSANKMIKIISDGHQGRAVGKETIIHLLSAADLTAQELDEIQQALDKKR
ncbi:hypothetical protein [Thalassomonas haliotis]|uniref:Uncharacterized protein n=1 Tax=Thalassomonas haliotis TaxID=485448 RepID=A0ABY7VAM4_9GAMM|nr:hypothetical protein [Thalassomonas haliotis]WDE09938.1 hypothetical protein H3N35_16685 [Thalassomonas haliotis]